MQIPQTAASSSHIVGLETALVLKWNFLLSLRKRHADFAANLSEWNFQTPFPTAEVNENPKKQSIVLTRMTLLSIALLSAVVIYSCE